MSGWRWLRSSSRSLWCFGSLRFWLTEDRKFTDVGWRYAQEVVWEKHNGSGFHADRFKRVHELAVHWYRGEVGIALPRNPDYERHRDTAASTA